VTCTNLQLRSQGVTVLTIQQDPNNETAVLLELEAGSVATQLQTFFHGMVVGGLMMEAEWVNGEGGPGPDSITPQVGVTPTSATSFSSKEPLYSGDKLISERFAEMKRAPKIPNSTPVRVHAKILLDEEVDPLAAASKASWANP